MVHGMDVLWALKRSVAVPLEHVLGARIDPRLRLEGPWLGAGQTDALLGWTVAAGEMMAGAGREFWDVRHPEKAIVIDLHGERYARLVVEVEDPAGTVVAINEAISRAPGIAA
jgi:hypothetical protein